MTAQAKKV